MDKHQLFIRAAFLATKVPPPGTVLCCGKETLPDLDNGFLFYLVESNASSQLAIGEIITKTIRSTLGSYSKEITYFESLLQKINTQLEKIPLLSSLNFNAIVGVVEDSEISLSQIGHITGYIFRKNKISSMTERGPETKLFTDVTSGKIVEGDHIVFGNADLFNRISLDRIRHLTLLNNAHEEILSLARTLRKVKAQYSNAIILEASTEENDQADLGVPDVVFLDESQDSFLHISKKKILPIALMLGKKAGKLKEKSGQISRKASLEWHQNYGPKTKELFSKGKAALKKSTAKSARPNLEITDSHKVTKPAFKAKSYKHKGASKFQIDTILLAMKTAGKKVIPFVRELFAEQNRKYLYLVLVGFLLIFGYSKIQSNNTVREVKTKEIQTLNSYDKALETFNDAKNDVLLGKPGSLEGVYEALSLAEKSSGAPENKERAEKLSKDIKAFVDERTKTVRFENSPSFVFGENVKQITLGGYEIYGFGSDGKIFMADARDKESKLLTVIPEENGSIVDITYSESSKKLLAYTAAKRIFAINPTDRSIDELKVSDDGAGWEEASSIAVYSSNIYLLSGATGEVWKHIQHDNGFSKGTSYANNKKVSIKDAVDLTIDGNMYVFKKDGTAIRFTKSSPDLDFSIKNIPEPSEKITVPSKIVSGEETNYLFLLDQGDNRIIKLDKTGEFANQYVFDKMTLTDFVVNSKIQKIWGLADGKIVEGNL
ncbi:MAG TPA: hypothetical protein PK263_03330 [bacterium]|nr:hypothetical protein [bacterium]